MKISNTNSVSQEDLVRLAMKLRNDWFDYEDRIGSSRDFVELKKAVGAMVVAILEPVEFQLVSGPAKKVAQLYQFPRRKGTVPQSLH